LGGIVKLLLTAREYPVPTGMTIEVREVDIDMLPVYAELPNSFKVESELRVEPIDGGLGGLVLVEQMVKPYIKYDEPETDPPEKWPSLFGEDRLGVLMAFRGTRPVGGTTLILGFQPGITTPFDKDGIAALWDIRVHPDERRSGIGSLLLGRSALWARERGCTYMRIETQNTNVPACKFYAKNGCILIAVHRQGYASTKLAHESMLLWHLDL
jgi:ribosomal protein S18 acetylase RimI-like enzyme